ncbi:hypothetical protein ACPEEZ_08430 [Frigoribacterium sp. 2-23]
MTSPFTMLGASDAVACEGDACLLPVVPASAAAQADEIVTPPDR